MGFGDLLEAARTRAPVRDEEDQASQRETHPNVFKLSAGVEEAPAPPEQTLPPQRVPFAEGVLPAEVGRPEDIPITMTTLARRARLNRPATPEEAQRVRDNIRQGRVPLSFQETQELVPGLFTLGTQRLISGLRGEGLDVFEKERGEGKSFTEALLAGYQAQDLPFAVKGSMEAFLQPDVLIPAGLVAGRAGGGLGRLLLRKTAKESAEELVGLGGKYAAQLNPTVQKFTGLLDNAKPIRAEVREAQRVERGIRAGRISDILSGEPDVFKALKMSRAARAGELPKGSFESVLGKLSTDEVRELLELVRTNPDLMPFEKVKALSLLDPDDVTSILNGKLPTLGEIGLLEQVFGERFAQAMLKKVPISTSAKIRTSIFEILNAPRTTFSSIDLSAPGRQAAPALAANPKVASRAFKAQLLAWRSEKNAVLINRSIINHPDAKLLQDAGVFIADVTGSSSGARLRFNAKTGEVIGSSVLSQREEAFISSLPQRIPGLGRAIRASERAYVTYLNKTRADIFYGTVKKWREAGEPLTEKKLKELGSMVNNLTGRGSLDFKDFIKLEEARPLFSAIFFSPGLQASRLQLAASLFDVTLDGAVRRELYKNIGSALTLGATIIGAAKASGLPVETDPRSSEFGKVRIGPTRLDFWGGFQPYARFAAQQWTEEVKLSSGDIRSLPDDFNTDRGGQAMRFGRSKLAPGASIIVDALVGETYLGDSPFRAEQAANTLVPGAIQDLWEAVQEQGDASGFFLGLPAFLGIGVSSYTTTNDLYNAVAARIPDEEGNVGRSFADLDSAERELVQEDPLVKERIAELDQREKPVPLPELRQVVFRQNEEFRKRAEAELLGRIDRGLQGRELLDAIQDFNRDRYTTAVAIFDPYRERLFKAPAILKDALAQQYWTAPVVLKDDGSLDFDARDLTREDILRRAREAGVDEQYVSGIGKGTWRGDISVDARLNEVLLQYDDDMNTLRSYWDIGSSPDYAGFAFRDTWELYVEGSQGQQRELARESPIIQRALRRRDVERASLREQDERVDKALVRWYEYLPKTTAGRLLYRSLYILE